MEISKLPIIHGKSCCEYSEDIATYLGHGRIVSFILGDPRSAYRPFFFCLDGEQVIYHTVVVININGQGYT